MDTVSVRYSYSYAQELLVNLSSAANHRDDRLFCQKTTTYVCHEKRYSINLWMYDNTYIRLLRLYALLYIDRYLCSVGKCKYEFDVFNEVYDRSSRQQNDLRRNSPYVGKPNAIYFARSRLMFNLLSRGPQVRYDFST